jgi:pimeloyl-ACP methyl ester carboxylesterase
MGSIKSLLTYTVAIAAVVAILLVIPVDPAQTADDDNLPVLLVHGLASGPESWEQLPDILHNRGFDDVYVLDFTDWEYVDFNSDNNDANPFEKVAAVIAREVHVIGLETGAEKVNIIAHSIGGLAVRAYMAGWGEEAEKRGKYSNNLNKIVYINTPFFGFNSEKISEEDLKTLLQDTNWGEFMKHAYFTDKLWGVSDTLVRLHEDVLAQGLGDEVEEVTIMTGDDDLMKPMSGNLSGLTHNPLFDQVNDNSDENHVTWLNYQHATHALIGDNGKTAIKVDHTDHPLLEVAQPFFNGSYGWRDKGKGISGDNDSSIIMALAGNQQIDTSEFSQEDIRVWKDRPNTDYRIEDVIWHADDELLEFEAINSGRYYIFTTKEPDEKYYFELNVILGATHLVFIDAQDLPDFDNMPPRVFNRDTAVQAARGIIGQERLTSPAESRSALAGICREIRDGIVAYYPNEWMIDLPNEPSRRLDVLRDVETGKLWDFFISWDKGDLRPISHMTWIDHGYHTDPDGGSKTYPGNWPKEITSVNDIRTIAIIVHGETKLKANASASSMKQMCREIRDAIIAHYDEWELSLADNPGARLDIVSRKGSGPYRNNWDFFISWDKPPSNAWGHLWWAKHEDIK